MGAVHDGQAAAVEDAEVPDERLETGHVAGRHDDDRGLRREPSASTTSPPSTDSTAATGSTWRVRMASTMPTSCTGIRPTSTRE